MKTRREFIRTTSGIALGTLALPYLSYGVKVKNVGIQLYTVKDAMLSDAKGTLKILSDIGYKELESARSEKGNYYGLAPKEVKAICKDLGMNMRSGHVHIDENWEKSVAQAVEAGQEYLVCSSLPSNGQTVDNYKKVADTFNKAAEDCKKAGLKFGYHNHEYEFDEVDGEVLYDILLENSDPKLVLMELDLGWVIVTGNDPVDYFKKYPGRFPLWHLKDMKKEHPESTEFGKGQVDIKKMMQNAKSSGMKYFFVEQEEYAEDPIKSIRHNFDYLKKLDY